jgi:hypothetical protein
MTPQQVLEKYVEKYVFGIYEYLTLNPNTKFLQGSGGNDEIRKFWDDVYDEVSTNEWFENCRVDTPLFTIWFGTKRNGWTSIQFKLKKHNEKEN